MPKENKKYKLIGYQPIGLYHKEEREEIAEWKNGDWYQYGRNKAIGNMVIEQVIEIK